VLAELTRRVVHRNIGRIKPGMALE
jgi:hypothetical protein